MKGEVFFLFLGCICKKKETYHESQPIAVSMGKRSEYGVCGGVVGRTQSLVGESEKRGGPKTSEHVWFLVL